GIPSVATRSLSIIHTRSPPAALSVADRPHPLPELSRTAGHWPDLYAALDGLGRHLLPVSGNLLGNSERELRRIDGHHVSGRLSVHRAHRHVTVWRHAEERHRTRLPAPRSGGSHQLHRLQLQPRTD